MSKKNKTEQVSTVDTSTTEAKVLVIVPGSTTVGAAEFHLLDPATGENIATKHCLGTLFAKADLVFGDDETVSELEERFGPFDVKFIDETEFNFDELVHKNSEWQVASTEAAPAQPAAPKPEPIVEDAPEGDAETAEATDELEANIIEDAPEQPEAEEPADEQPADEAPAAEQQ